MNNHSDNLGNQIDPFTDNIMGEWQQNKEKTNKKTIWYKREATIQLNETYAQNYIEPETGEKFKIFGEVLLVEEKALDIKTSLFSFFNKVDKTQNSQIKPIVK